MRVEAWSLRAPRASFVSLAREEAAGPGEVLVRVAGCAVQPEDVAIYHGKSSSSTRLPLTLGAEISGQVVETGAGAECWGGQSVVIPASLPCHRCSACEAGRGQLCAAALRPGRNIHGGFASHVRVPARSLCRVPWLGDRWKGAAPLELAHLALLSDSFATPYQALARGGLVQGDVAVFVGMGLGAIAGIQLAVARGAQVVAIDTDPRGLELAQELGAALTLPESQGAGEPASARIEAFAAGFGCPTWRIRLFETSSSDWGAKLALSLLGRGQTLVFVGRRARHTGAVLPELAALDAVLAGSVGCAPELYPALLRLVLTGQVRVAPFARILPMDALRGTLETADPQAHMRRAVLVPK
ncbi:MAG: alcohol dehydrogenase catalytic domain-containing protein [Planctomycetaceae bacterium]|jgi:6-hydroxycyclohex-1-ene-1-carbonyl-CoA dehydrogenase|nr:alcohol dehydrogenase catalytic domain-containing protein [Planctomycetaceae bacterium]